MSSTYDLNIFFKLKHILSERARQELSNDIQHVNYR